MVFPFHLLPSPQLRLISQQSLNAAILQRKKQAHTSNDLLGVPQLVSGEDGIQSQALHTNQMIVFSPDTKDG